MSKDKSTRAMSRPELEDEVMLLRAQVKVLQDWVRLTKERARNPLSLVNPDAVHDLSWCTNSVGTDVA